MVNKIYLLGLRYPLFDRYGVLGHAYIKNGEVMTQIAGHYSSSDYYYDLDMKNKSSVYDKVYPDGYEIEQLGVFETAEEFDNKINQLRG